MDNLVATPATGTNFNQTSKKLDKYRFLLLISVFHFDKAGSTRVDQENLAFSQTLDNPAYGGKVGERGFGG